MNSINLFHVVEAKNNENLAQYIQELAQTVEPPQIREHEIDTLSALVKNMKSSDGISNLDGFYFGFIIEQIGKEFDLIKYDKKIGILNVELKAENVGIPKMRQQLERNRYYLSGICSSVFQFTFVLEDNKLYKYTMDGGLVDCEMDELKSINDRMVNYCESGLEILFRPRNYLVSPLNSPEKFISGRYFLTLNQEEIKKKIFDEISKGKAGFGIKGSAGTGKTLLGYDIARELSKKDKVCIVHCGIKCEGHAFIEKKIENITILSAKDITSYNLMGFRYVIVDESQRIYSDDLDRILEQKEKSNLISIFLYDYFQVLSKSEEKRDIPETLKRLKDFCEYELSSKIRTNKNIVSFIRNMHDLSDTPRTKMDYSDVEVFYAKNVDDGKMIIRDYYRTKGYEFINYTQSRYYSNSIDKFGSRLNTHHVVGQEFDNVIIFMDKNFRYGPEGILQTAEHPNPNYIFYKLLYQAMSRSREKLCIVVIDNYPLFDQILKIKANGNKIKSSLRFRE